jgi:hypothetical protein
MLKDPEPLARRSQPIPIYRESSTELIKFRMTKKGLLRQPLFLPNKTLSTEIAGMVTSLCFWLFGY